MKSLSFPMDAGQMMICVRKVNLLKQDRQFLLPPQWHTEFIDAKMVLRKHWLCTQKLKMN